MVTAVLPAVDVALTAVECVGEWYAAAAKNAAAASAVATAAGAGAGSASASNSSRSGAGGAGAGAGSSGSAAGSGAPPPPLSAPALASKAAAHRDCLAGLLKAGADTTAHARMYVLSFLTHCNLMGVGGHQVADLATVWESAAKLTRLLPGTAAASPAAQLQVHARSCMRSVSARWQDHWLQLDGEVVRSGAWRCAAGVHGRPGWLWVSRAHITTTARPALTSLLLALRTRLLFSRALPCVCVCSSCARCRWTRAATSRSAWRTCGGASTATATRTVSVCAAGKVYALER